MKTNLKQLVLLGRKYFGPGFEARDFTCYDCPHAIPDGPDGKICEFAWDLYNTKGDCLALK